MVFEKIRFRFFGKVSEGGPLLLCLQIRGICLAVVFKLFNELFCKTFLRTFSQTFYELFSNFKKRLRTFYSLRENIINYKILLQICRDYNHKLQIITVNIRNEWITELHNSIIIVCECRLLSIITYLHNPMQIIIPIFIISAPPASRRCIPTR